MRPYISLSGLTAHYTRSPSPIEIWIAPVGSAPKAMSIAASYSCADRRPNGARAAAAPEPQVREHGLVRMVLRQPAFNLRCARGRKLRATASVSSAAATSIRSGSASTSAMQLRPRCCRRVTT